MPKDSACGFRLAGDQHDRRRSRVGAGAAFTGSITQSPRLGSQSSEPFPQGNGFSEAHRTAKRPARACLRATYENVRGRHGSGQRSTKSEKVQGESASSALKRCRSSGASDRERPKLATANSFVDSPFPDRANGWERMREHSDKTRGWRKRATAPSRNVQRGGHRAGTER